MFRDVSVFGSGVRIYQAAVSLPDTFTFHSDLFVRCSLNLSSSHVIIIVDISLVYVKCSEKLSPDRKVPRTFMDFSLSALVVALTEHGITHRKGVSL